ncbi:MULTISPECIES: AI-2E family transporter [Curtobacterium]|jgi:predicted PurR-regulated permease PerM|uniref:AI-2E family transporter n=1 Tax=Curtobacterium TaxID=2034 RepID=UPI001563ED7A|nr:MULTISPECIES: AI-2E family transporter [Curtobacterium]MBT1584079.1 AI-2E family transporter [Curtobacterium flaccumfaciens pv. flaccumfaciens]MBT1608115.1 AI-2E family transporter [Curtobacterium flaccumfaciens pv. betae]MBT1633531.1 AI-2E family transporter [Curtobacterium flaccumfaciens pv. oortii]MBT1656142.1 AI-2E family transporter [Curtobacterium flaccumfaciens pv. betae]MCS0469992.1 AI-2E family transporter [Curtobacterium flaccumfaciens pv. betae]
MPRKRDTSQDDHAPTPNVTFEVTRGGTGVRVNAFRIGFMGAIGVLVALLAGSIINELSTVLVYIGVALFLALGIDPLVSFLERIIPRWSAITIVVVVVLGAFAGIVFAVVPILVEQTSNLVQNFPEIVQDISQQPWVQDLSKQFAGSFDIDHALQSLQSFVEKPGNLLSVGGGILAVGSGILSGVTGALIVIILMLYFLASMRGMKRAAYRFVPASRRQNFIDVSEQITQAVGRYVVGQVSQALINGILSFIFLLIIGAPLPVLLAFIAFLGSLIPLVGTLAAAIVISLLCFFASPATALFSGIYYLVYMQVEAYLISPRIMSRAVQVPGALVVIAAVAGGTIGGVLGALVALPVAASVIIIVQKVIYPRQEQA